MNATSRTKLALRQPTAAARSVLIAAGFALSTALATAQSEAYVAANAIDALAVVDTATGAVSTSVAVGDMPAHVAFSADGARAYVTNTGSDSISVVDTASNSVVATIAVGDAPGTSVPTPDGQRLYVSTAGGVQLVDLQTNSVLQTIATGGSSGFLAIAPDGSRVYQSSGSIAVIDTATNAVITTLYAGAYTSGIAVSPDGARLYVANTIYNFASVFSASGGVTVFDTATDTATASINTWYLPNTVALSPDGSHLYVSLAWQWSNTGYGAGFLPTRFVSDIDTNSNTVVGSTLLSNTGAGMAVTADGTQVYVAVRVSNTVSVIDAASHAVTSDIPVAGGPIAVAFKPFAAQPPVNYCTAGVTTNGCNAHVTASGIASASAGSGFDVLVSNVEGQRSGLIFYGVDGESATPWHSGSSFMCVKAPIQRTASQSSGGSLDHCDGALALDFNAYLASHPSALGQPFGTSTSVYLQAWFRDPTAPGSTNLSDALRFTVAP
jgi:YVTN family beta-propeller protein